MKRKVFMHVVVNVMLVAVVVCVSSVGLFSATANAFKKDDSAPIYRGSSKNKVSLMINVYWGTEYLDGILGTLKKYGAHATFFVGGSWVADHPEYLQKMVQDGHEIGNHGYFHKQYSKLTYNENVSQIDSCGKIVAEYVGASPVLFAPPGGDFSSNTLSAAKSCGCKTVMWSRDTIDWRDKDADTIFTRATKDVSGGELILMHPTAHTLQALDKILDYYLKNNLQPATVSETIGEI